MGSGVFDAVWPLAEESAGRMAGNICAIGRLQRFAKAALEKQDTLVPNNLAAFKRPIGEAGNAAPNNRLRYMFSHDVSGTTAQKLNKSHSMLSEHGNL